MMHEEEIGDCMPGSSRGSMELLKTDHNFQGFEAIEAICFDLTRFVSWNHDLFFKVMFYFLPG